MESKKNKNPILKKKTLHYVEKVADSDATMIHIIKPGDVDLINKKFQVRKHYELLPLTESIKTYGQQVPVILAGKQAPYPIICGHRRCESINELEGTIKAIIIPDISEEDALRLSILENEERENLTDLDKANSIRMLQKSGKTQEEIGRIMGMSQTGISRYLSVFNLSDAICEALGRKWISMKHAMILKNHRKVCTGEYLEKLIEEIRDKDLSARELESKLRAPKTPATPRSKPEYFKKTTGGFRVTASYKPNLPEAEKRKVYAALKEALSMLEAELDVTMVSEGEE